MFSRLFLFGLALVLQVSWLLYTAYSLSNYYKVINVLLTVLSILAVIYIINSRYNPAMKLAWIVPILIFPLLGGVLFLISGGKAPKRKLARAMANEHQRLRPTLPDCRDTIQAIGDANLEGQCRYLARQDFPVYTGTRSEYFPLGEDGFQALVQDLEQAEHFIFLEYFIIHPGIMWDTILDILLRKAAQGVDVRLIYDDVGSVSTLPLGYAKKLEAQGIQAIAFNPFIPVYSTVMNNRDHRKITVIDGVTGYVSGLNLADEYVDRKERFGYWKDNALRLRGEATWSLTVFFLTMWDHQNPHSDFRLFRPRQLPPLETTGGIVIPYADTPNADDTIGADLYLQMISKAKRYLYITTPYLAIDETITSALCIAARTGVDVRIMTPHIPDKKGVFAVTQSNYPVLLEAGARIFEFTPGFVHTKTMVADDLYASVGSCNLDYRSFYLQFENGVWLCGDPAVLSVRDDFLQTMEVCQEITLDDCRTLSFPRRIVQTVYRLFAPLF